MGGLLILRRKACGRTCETEEVLLEVGGYSWDEIGRFREEGLYIKTAFSISS
ncbi:MAG: hypothetical protein Q7R34_11975 [Dehalococcoidia bacterium]|nr:hypothetical protein [Dehalococcoidia bacterium]